MDNQEKDVVILKKTLEGDTVVLTEGMFTGYDHEMIVAVKRLYENDSKRQSRMRRCLNVDGTRCWDKKCRECPRKKDGLPLSMNQLEEDGVLPQDGFSVEAYIEQKEQCQALYVALDALDEKNRQIVLLTCMEGHAERAIEDIVGLKQSSINLRKRNAIKKLKKMLKDFA